MAQKTNNPFKFWEELKRRKVVRVIIGYAAASFVILELTSIISEPFGLPEWTLNLVFVLLCIGFIFSIYFSWVFDVTPKGIKKTESAKSLQARKATIEHAKWNLKASDVVIAVLIVIVIIMSYPKVFKSEQSLASMTIPVTFTNELGEKETSQVFKEEYIHRLMVFPFEPSLIDTINKWLVYGIPWGVLEDLKQFQYVLAYGHNSLVKRPEQISIAKSKNCSYFLSGTYKFEDGKYSIKCNLNKTSNGSIVKETTYVGSDLFNILDSISRQTRKSIGIHENIVNNSTDLTLKDCVTEDIDAYRYFIWGHFRVQLKKGDRYSNYNKSIRSDSTFALPSLLYAKSCHFYQSSRLSAEKYIVHTMNNRKRLSDYRDMEFQILYSAIMGDRENTIEQSELQYNLYPGNIDVLSSLIDIYYNNALFSKAHEHIIKLNELIPDNPEFQLMLAESFLYTNRINKGLRYIEKRIKENPENTTFLLRKGQFHLHKEEWDKAEAAFNNAIFESPENTEKWSSMLEHINFARDYNIKTIDLEKFIGKFRSGGSELATDQFIHNDYLYNKADNQHGCFYYPTSDTSFVGLFGYFRTSYYLNDLGTVYKEKTIQSSYNNQSSYEYPIFYWLQDSLIVNAEEILESKKYKEALAAFQKAYALNPEHYYLANYIKHLEFILSEDYDRYIPLMDLYEGQYEPLGSEIYKYNGQLIGKAPNSTEHFILPISKNQFMFPGAYHSTLEFIEENGQISGMQATLFDGRGYFYKRIVD